MGIFKRFFSKQDDSDQRVAQEVSTPVIPVPEVEVEVAAVPVAHAVASATEPATFPPVFFSTKDFSDGVLVDGVLVRRARANDRKTYERHYKMAMGIDAPLEPSQMRNFGGYGSMVVAMATGDDEFWASRAKDSKIVNDLWHEMTIVLVAEVEGQVVGSIMIGPPRFQLVQYVNQCKEQGFKDPDQLHSSVLMLSMGSAKLFSLAVDESARKQGVGKALVNAGFSIFEAGGYGIVWGQCPPSARGFYNRLGFEVLPMGHSLELKKESAHWDRISAAGPEHMFSFKMRERTSADLLMLAMKRGYQFPSEQLAGQESDIEWAQFSDGPHLGLIVAPTISAWANVGMSRDSLWSPVSALEVQIDLKTGKIRIGGDSKGIQSVSFQAATEDFEWMLSMINTGECRLITADQVSPAVLSQPQLSATISVRSV